MKTISRWLACLIILALLFVSLPSIAYAVPVYHSFYGTVKINGAFAPVGTVVTAKVAGVDCGSYTTTEVGKYGDPGTADYFLVQGDITEGKTINFYVNGYDTGETANFSSGSLPTELNLTVTISVAAPAPAGGGGGGAGVDTTPPRLSDFKASAIAETTADICWTTNELSTTQVEYWSSPSMLSPLDETLVVYHEVHLTDLTPGTTYYYKTMSKDRTGNEAVSDEYSFTTLGAPPEPAAFKYSSLAISPTEVDIGQAVSISILVANTGDESGSSEVTLKINALVEETKRITIAAGDSKRVSFSITKDIAGTYEVDVNGLTGSFTVKEAAVAPAPAPAPAPPPPAPPPTPPAPPVPWPIIGAIIGGVIVVGLLVFLIVRRRA